jgi:hypothetical protein
MARVRRAGLLVGAPTSFQIPPALARQAATMSTAAARRRRPRRQLRTIRPSTSAKGFIFAGFAQSTTSRLFQPRQVGLNALHRKANCFYPRLVQRPLKWLAIR